MKRVFAAAALAAATVSSFATDVGVSVSVSQPGLYGRIDIGSFPAPAPVLVYPQPVVIAPTQVAVHQQPIYMHVPPGHAKNWGKHCGRYNACGQPVYFVREEWYQRQYVPAYQQHQQGRKDKHGHGNGNGKGKGKGKHGG